MPSEKRRTGFNDGGMAQAARDLSAAARELSAAARQRGGGIAAGWQDETASAVARGFLLAMRRAQSDPIVATTPDYRPGGLRGSGYGRMGASITGSGERAQSYGAIGGMIGYAVGGPIGGLVGGMLGGLFGGKKKKSKSQLQRQWLNTPEAFEIQAYLYNLRGLGSLSGLSGRARVRVDRVTININGQGAAAGLEAGRAFATFLGRQVALNSAVTQAPGEV